MPAEYGEFRDRRADRAERVAERARVEGQRFQRAPVQRRALRLLFVIGMHRVGAEFHLGLRLERRDRLWARIQERLAHRSARVIAHDAVEKMRGVRAAVAGVDRYGMQRIGDPGRAGRERGRAADIFRALDQQHRLACYRAEQSGGEAAGAGADDDQIELAVIGERFGRDDHCAASAGASANSRKSSIISCKALYMSAPVPATQPRALAAATNGEIAGEVMTQPT